MPTARSQRQQLARRRADRSLTKRSGGFDAVLSAAFHAREWERDPALRACALRAIADGLDAERREIIAVVHAETALTPAELGPEFDRMVNTLRMFSSEIERRAWHHATISTSLSLPQHAIGPNHDLRSMLIPLGPVAVFGASNFPLAYGVCGGDTASALAAGCSVVVKEHPAHPRSGRLIHAIAQDALYTAKVNPIRLGYVPHENTRDLSIPRRLVTAPMIRAVGFTGSTTAGRALDDLARARDMPIPVFAEMGSINPVRISPQSLARRAERIAHELADSVLQRHGQQCTKPGVIFVQPGKGLDRFLNVLAARFEAAPARDMLSPWIRDAYVKRLQQAKRVKGVRVLARGEAAKGPRVGVAQLLYVKRYAPLPATLMEEVFGPATLVCELDEWFDVNIPRPTALTWSIYQEPRERVTFGTRFEPGIAQHFAGRVIFNGPPTGVRVAHASNHSGPWPACNRPDTTAVGPRAIERWCRHVCWQNCPEDLLPPALQNANPLKIERLVNGVRTRAAIRR